MKRRDFLKLSAAAGLSGLAAACGMKADGIAAVEVLPAGSGFEKGTASALPVSAVTGSGQVVLELEEGSALLDAAQADLLGQYMDTYYTALAHLQEPEGWEILFATSQAAEEAASALRFQLGLRGMTPGADYRLLDWSYTLRCTAAELDPSGAVTVQATEDSAQTFAHSPDLPSRRYNVWHSFTLMPTPDGWRLDGHISFDALMLTVLRAEGQGSLESRYAAAMPAFLEENRAQAARRSTQRTASTLPQADHPYNREAALDYALAHASVRSPDWADYTGLGGNCQNYVSQCLLAGGIPMDTAGPSIWKWYGDSVSSTSDRAGRSSSWSGVDEFMTYARANTGYGLAAQVDAPYLTGSPGDLIQMGEGESWRHVVIISRPVVDSEGQTVDYLVCANTSDLENWPASLYGYPRQMLTRIAGWND